MKYGVTIPLGCHAYIEVDAPSKAEAIELAMDQVGLEHIEDWQAITEINGPTEYCQFPASTKVKVVSL